MIILSFWGDWNVVLDMNLDICNYKRMVNRPRSRNEVKEMMSVHELVDPWREIHQEKRRYTWRKYNTTKKRASGLFSCIGRTADLYKRSKHRIMLQI